MNDAIYIVGIDCATDSQKVGVSFGRYTDGVTTLESTEIGTRGQSIAELVFAHITDAENVLIAIDAPLGWPRYMGECLVDGRETTFGYRSGPDCSDCTRGSGNH